MDAILGRFWLVRVCVWPIMTGGRCKGCDLDSRLQGYVGTKNVI